MKLCDKITKLRKKNGLSQEELANKLDVSRQSVFKWESGENSPDLEKIKKLAKLFNVSFDILLDDNKDIEDTNNNRSATEIITKKPIKFRKTFDSGVRLETISLSDIEHGYADGRKKVEGYSYSATLKKHNELIKKKGYSKIVHIQNDVCVDFYVDDKNKTFGFFFDGAPQFVCPFENFASFSISNDGPSTGFAKASVVGVGIGGNKGPTIGVGSMPVGHTRPPSTYDCALSYFDENGNLKNYKMSISCMRKYILFDGTARSVEAALFWEDGISEYTNKHLNEICSYLNGIKEVGQFIKDGSVKVYPIDVQTIAKEVRTGQMEKKKIGDEFNAIIKRSRKRIRIGILIGIIVVVVAVGVTVTTCSVQKLVQNNQVTEVNRNKAKEVENLIDAIGEVTLYSEGKITKAKNAYSALTQTQKSYVSNYNKLIAASNEYARLVQIKREEETKDDPSRTIVLSDLNGKWVSTSSAYDYMMIDDIGGAKSVLYFISGKYNATLITTISNSSYLNGYNNKIRAMEVKLYHYTGLIDGYINASMTKSSNNEFTLLVSGVTYTRVVARS